MRTIISTDELAASTLPLSYELGNLYRGTHSSQFGTLRSLLLKDCPLLHFTLMFGDDVRWNGTKTAPNTVLTGTRALPRIPPLPLPLGSVPWFMGCSSGSSYCRIGNLALSSLSPSTVSFFPNSLRAIPGAVIWSTPHAWQVARHMLRTLSAPLCAQSPFSSIKTTYLASRSKEHRDGPPLWTAVSS